MHTFLRRAFGAREAGPALTSRLGRQRLEAAALQLREGLERAMIEQRMAAAAEAFQGKGLSEEAMARALTGALQHGRGIEAAGLNGIRGSLCLAELVVALADVEDGVDPTLLPSIIAELLPLLGLPGGIDLGRTLQSLHGETVAAMLPGGWQEPCQDVAQFRDESWGLRAGNLAANFLVRQGWPAAAASLPQSLTDLIGRDLLVGGIDPPPLPPERLPLPRRRPERWMAAAEALGAAPAGASIRGRAEATEACLKRLLDGAFADRLQDLLLNGGAVDPAVAVMPVPPVVGLLVIDMAAHATGHLDKLQPAAEVEAARLAVAVFGLSPVEATAAARRWAELWDALIERYDGRSTPLLGAETDYALLAFAQTRGRKLGEMIKDNLGIAPPGDFVPAEAETRALARLFRFAEALPPSLPLPALGTWPAPQRAPAVAALRRRLVAARLTDVRATGIGAGEETALTRRLARHFRLLDRLLPWPEYCSTRQLPDLMEHFGTQDPAEALEQVAVSIALEEPFFTIFVAGLCLETAGADLPASEALALFRLSLERVQPGSASLLKVVPREEWLGLTDEKSGQAFALAHALRGRPQWEPDAAGGQAAKAAVALAARFADVLGSDATAGEELLEEFERAFVVTPESLRQAARAAEAL